MTIRVLLADDHAMVRQGLRMFLQLDPELDVIGEAADGLEAVRLAHELRPDVILMDILMPRLDGLAATVQLRQELPEVEIIALTSVTDDATVIAVINAGAMGYLLKDTDAPELVQAIKSAAAGQVQLSPQVAERLAKDVPVPNSPEHLTERETEVLRLLAVGLSNKEIGQTLGIAEKTVKSHVSSILSKLNLLSRTQAAMHAVRSGLVRP